MLLNVKSKITKKILNYFFLNEKGRAYVNEIARIVEEEPKNVHRTLLKLEGSGILKSEYAGRERYFSANTNSPLYEEYKKIFQKTVGIEIILTGKLKELSGLKKAYIYGSYASGDLKAGSDIDILLVGKHSSLSAQKIIHEVEKKIGKEVNVVNLTPEEFNRRKQTHDHFIETILQSKYLKKRNSKNIR